MTDFLRGFRNAFLDAWAILRCRIEDRLFPHAAIESAALRNGFHVCPRHDFDIVADPKEGCPKCNVERATLAQLRAHSDEPAHPLNARQAEGTLGIVDSPDEKESAGIIPTEPTNE